MNKNIATFLMTTLLGCGGGGSDKSSLTGVDEGPDSGQTADVADAGGSDADGTVAADAGSPDATPQDCQQVPLLQDGFDTQPSTWRQYSTEGYETITDASVTGTAPISPSRVAWLSCLGAGYYDLVAHRITLPAGTAALTVAGYYLVDAQQEGSQSSVDRVSLTLRSTDGDVLTTLGGISNLTETVEWTAFTWTADVAASGNADLDLRSETDSFDIPFGPSNYFFDSITVTATVCE